MLYADIPGSAASILLSNGGNDEGCHKKRDVSEELTGNESVTREKRAGDAKWLLCGQD